jgi:beta-N-acetylhexosaminidase
MSIGRRFYSLVSLFLILSGLHAQHEYPSEKQSQKWADSILRGLRFEQLIAQKLMVPAWSRDATLSSETIEAVEKYQVGGIIFFQGTAQTHNMALNYYQQISAIPLLIGMDAEWGPAMRLDHVSKYPYPLSIGTTKDEDYAFEIGKSQGRMLNALGVHINFAPVVDLNTNPNNPIIGFRSFGENAQSVNPLATAFHRGLEASGVWACAKHFPGHGNTIADSHKELPVVSHDKKSLKKELAPFEAMIDAGVKSIMMAHLKVPFLDDRPNMPSSLSRAVVHDLLREKMEFKGLIITDAMNMKGVSAHYAPDVAILKAIQAGNDILCFVDNVPQVMSLCRSWLDSSWIDSIEIAESVRRILIAKHQLGLSKNLDVTHIQRELDSEYSRFIKKTSPAPATPYCEFDPSFEAEIEAASAHICLLAPDKSAQLPWKPHRIDTLNAVIFGERLPDVFYQRLQSYQYSRLVWAQNFANADTLLKHLDSIGGHHLFFNSNQRMWGNQSRHLPVLLKEVLERLPNASKSVLVHTGNVYALQGLRSNIPVILGMETGESYMVASLDALFGHRGIRGKLPVSIDSLWNPKIELNTRAWIRFRSLELSDPELLGFNCDEGASLNGIMDSVILSGASQTAQLLVLKNGHIVYDISRGKMPDGKRKVNMHSIYDIASITKTAATTLAVMHVFEKEDINLEKPIQAYWPEARKFAWGSVKIQDFLLHRSGLPAFLPLYSTLKSDSFFIQRDSLHQPKSGDILWGNSLYLNRSVSDTVWAMIGQTAPKIYHKSQDLQLYIYSDLNAIILGKWIEYRSGSKLAVFCDSIFYTPMGMFRTGFEPRSKQLTPWIMPTQIDTATKRGLIWAETHDPTAYLLGGSAGNAGLFSSAYDLARLMLMLAQGGILDGTRYFKTETIERFTSGFLYADNHRGLGFDKPNGYPNALKNSEIKGSNLFEGAPNSLFGHAGFTGTWAYADAKNQLVWIFLSNRTFPNDSQNKLAKKGYRGKLMEIVYRSLKADDKP